MHSLLLGSDKPVQWCHRICVQASAAAEGIDTDTPCFRPVCFVLEVVAGSSANQHTLNSTTDYSTSASAHGSALCNHYDDIAALHCNAYHIVLHHQVLHSATLFYSWNFLDLQATLKLPYLWSGPTDHSYARSAAVTTIIDLRLQAAVIIPEIVL